MSLFVNTSFYVLLLNPLQVWWHSFYVPKAGFCSHIIMPVATNFSFKLLPNNICAVGTVSSADLQNIRADMATQAPQRRGWLWNKDESRRKTKHCPSSSCVLQVVLLCLPTLLWWTQSEHSPYNMGLWLPFSHSSTQSLSKSWEYWSTSAQLGPPCSGELVGSKTVTREKKLLPTSIKEKGMCSGWRGICTAGIETGIPKSCVNGIRNIFPNRTESWGWLSFCSSKQPFQPLVLQNVLCATCQPSSEWGGRGETLHAQCHRDGCQETNGSGARNEVGISVGLGKAKPSLQMV